MNKKKVLPRSYLQLKPSRIKKHVLQFSLKGSETLLSRGSYDGVFIAIAGSTWLLYGVPMTTLQ